MRTVNLGILAHVDAGKTSLTERLLHTAGIIDEIGSVDDGNTLTDSLALERQRGITIKSAVVSLVIDDLTVNLIDTPGHPDFIAEVERVLEVLDGAIIVVSAVEGVQAQTRVLVRTLQRLRIPTLVFVNKIDRFGADVERVLHGIARKLTPAIVPMGTASRVGTRTPEFCPYDGTEQDFTARLTELLAEHDDEILAAYVDGDVPVPYSTLRTRLTEQVGQARVHPMYAGSAITGTGVDALVSGIRELLPSTDDDADGPVSGLVFKVDRGPTGDKRAYVRMFSGAVHNRDVIRFGRGEQREAKVTGVQVFEDGSTVSRSALPAGRIGILSGLREIRIGDPIGEPRPGSGRHHFAPPTLETVLTPRHRADKGRLHLALTQLAEQDPLIDLRHDDVRQETSVSLYGEVQKEVIEATLMDEYGITVDFRESTTICVVRVTGVGEAVEVLKLGDNPFLATVGLRIEPGPVDSGVRFCLGVELGSMPYSFFKAVEETVHETLREGLYGWQVIDCVVTMTRSGYLARQSRPHAGFDKSMSSTAGDFRNLTPLVLMTALRRAGTSVHEPMHRFELEFPAGALGPVLPALSKLQAVPYTPVIDGETCTLDGEIPAARVHELQQLLPGLTQGEGILTSAFSRYQPVRGRAPSRSRTDHDPLDRKEYLLRVVRRVAGLRDGG
ncbi:MAG TPA: translation factor GTPase family protein [Actinopolymorphaceae bacterium]